MQILETYQRPAFLRDHPPVLARMTITGIAGAVLPAGSVLGRDASGNLGLWTRDRTVAGILAADVKVSASGTAPADVYIHADVVAEELVFADGVTADEERQALAALRTVGIYSDVTWASAPASESESTQSTPAGE